MADLSGWLATKYGLLQQNADTQRAAQESLARYQDANTKIGVPAEAQERIARAGYYGAQGGLAGAQTQGINFNNQRDLRRSATDDLNFEATSHYAGARLNPASEAGASLFGGASGNRGLGGLPGIGDKVVAPGLGLPPIISREEEDDARRRRLYPPPT